MKPGDVVTFSDELRAEVIEKEEGTVVIRFIGDLHRGLAASLDLHKTAETVTRSVVPALAELPEGHETQLDLLPHEWEVLSLIDGERDLRAMAQQLGRSEFDTAKVVFGLITTGVVEVTRLKDEDAAEVFLSFRVGSVGRGDFAVFPVQGHCRFRRLER